MAVWSLRSRAAVVLVLGVAGAAIAWPAVHGATAVGVPAQAAQQVPKPAAVAPHPKSPPVAVAPGARARTQRAAVHATLAVTRRASAPTSWPSLNSAITRIPHYQPGLARWVVENTGWWATADWDAGVIYISPTTPTRRLYDVVVHEWAHMLTVHAYGGNVAAAVHATDAYFGGSGEEGAERAADCMAILQGARWTHYTSCQSPTWRSGARRLLAGKPL